MKIVKTTHVEKVTRTAEITPKGDIPRHERYPFLMADAFRNFRVRLYRNGVHCWTRYAGTETRAEAMARCWQDGSWDGNQPFGKDGPE